MASKVIVLTDSESEQPTRKVVPQYYEKSDEKEIDEIMAKDADEELDAAAAYAYNDIEMTTAPVAAIDNDSHREELDELVETAFEDVRQEVKQAQEKIEKLKKSLKRAKLALVDSNIKQGEALVKVDEKQRDVDLLSAEVQELRGQVMSLNLVKRTQDQIIEGLQEEREMRSAMVTNLNIIIDNLRSRLEPRVLPVEQAVPLDNRVAARPARKRKTTVDVPDEPWF